MSKIASTVYVEDGRFSYFRDRIEAHRGDIAASERLRQWSAEARANPTVVTGQGIEFTAPEWLSQDFAPGAAAGGVAADLIGLTGGRRPLPRGRSSMAVV